MPYEPISFTPFDASQDSVIREKVREKIEKDHFVNLKVDDLQEVQEYFAGEKTIDEERIIDFQVLIYRFYNQVKVEGDKLVCSASSGSEIGISEDVFQLYKNDLARLNADVAKMENEDRPDEEALSRNLEEQIKQLIE